MVKIGIRDQVQNKLLVFSFLDNMLDNTTFVKNILIQQHWKMLEILKSIFSTAVSWTKLSLQNWWILKVSLCRTLIQSLMIFWDHVVLPVKHISPFKIFHCFMLSITFSIFTMTLTQINFLDSKNNAVAERVAVAGFFSKWLYFCLGKSIRFWDKYSKPKAKHLHYFIGNKFWVQAVTIFGKLTAKFASQFFCPFVRNIWKIAFILNLTCTYRFNQNKPSGA